MGPVCVCGTMTFFDACRLPVCLSESQNCPSARLILSTTHTRKRSTYGETHAKRSLQPNIITITCRALAIIFLKFSMHFSRARHTQPMAERTHTHTTQLRNVSHTLGPHKNVSSMANFYFVSLNRIHKSGPTTTDTRRRQREGQKKK